MTAIKGESLLNIKTTFKRLEKKYILSISQYEKIKCETDKRFNPDEFGETKICNIYFDTPNNMLIRRSIEKPKFKEKLRLRTYGVPTSSDYASFIEIKRKYDSEVYKRRIGLPLSESMDFLCNGKFPSKETQIAKEISYFLSFYDGIAPAFYISYDRSAFFLKSDENMRLTFDKNIVWRDYDLDLAKGSYGSLLIPEDIVLMEIKVPSAVPLWLAELLSNFGAFGSSFSKVGNAYINSVKQRSNINEQIISEYIY